MDNKKWYPDVTYIEGEVIIYNKKIYISNYWTKGDNPETSNGIGKPWRLK